MKKTIFAAILILCAASAAAQTFNPRVEVTNTFEGKVMDAQKQGVSMAVPDSLLQFQYKLDYSVFDNPYNGSYDFQPYRIAMVPDPVLPDNKHLYVNLGAGYTIHPEADLVFTPSFRNKPFTLSLYDTFRGYYGPYGHQSVTDYALLFKVGDIERSSDGYFLNNRAGAAARYEWTDLALDFDGAYHLVSADDTLSMHFMQTGEFLLRLAPVNPYSAGYFHDAYLSVRAGKDDFQYMTHRHKLGVNNMEAGASFGGNFDAVSSCQVDVGMQTVIYTGFIDATSTRAWAAPKYVARWKSGSAQLGVKFSYLTGGSRHDEPGLFEHESQIIYPDVKVKQFLVHDHLAMYLNVGGGDNLNVYSDLLESNPFMDVMALIPTLDSSSEKINASAGFQGNIGSKFQFDLGAGYVMHANGICDAFSILYNDDTETCYLAPYKKFRDYNVKYASASILWQSPRLDIDGHFRYQRAGIYGNNLVDIPKIVADASVTYNWSRRFFIGASVYGNTERFGAFANPSAPEISSLIVHFNGFWDLGANCRYVINPRWSVWLKGGNLLGQTVQRMFLHPETGRYGVAGITFNI